ncbi:hypothetical protein VPH35_098323 [Triticum aestivum]|uniref:Uncharacterized protein n=1 Tax=Aegilops tauschii TaxID=37682 RepID=R7WFE9_AEGTA
MEFIFQDKHATGEFTVLQTPYDRVHARDKDFIGDTEKNVSDVKVDPATHDDSDCVPDDTTNECSSSKRPRGDKRDKEYPLFIRLALQTSAATNEQVASMLKGRPMAAIQEFVRCWIGDNFPEYVPVPPAV